MFDQRILRYQVVLMENPSLTISPCEVINPDSLLPLGSVPELGRFLEEGMATNSSILAWKIPWTEKAGRL